MTTAALDVKEQTGQFELTLAYFQKMLSDVNSKRSTVRSLTNTRHILNSGREYYQLNFLNDTAARGPGDQLKKLSNNVDGTRAILTASLQESKLGFFTKAK